MGVNSLPETVTRPRGRRHTHLLTVWSCWGVAQSLRFVLTIFALYKICVYVCMGAAVDQ